MAAGGEHAPNPRAQVAALLFNRIDHFRFSLGRLFADPRALDNAQAIHQDQRGCSRNFYMVERSLGKIHSCEGQIMACPVGSSLVCGLREYRNHGGLARIDGRQ